MQTETAARTRQLPQAMAFYHGDGLVPAWKLAEAYAGTAGRIATMPDIWDARLATAARVTPDDVQYIRTPPRLPAWEQYFTTRSAEYCGRSKGGNFILIVAHGIGPMADFDGIMRAYAYQYKDKTSDICGGLITNEEFLRLESGFYGDVAIVDLKDYEARYEYPFIADIDAEQAATDPLLRARLGSRASECIMAMHRIEQAWSTLHAEEIERHLHGRRVANPRPARIFSVADNANFSYGGAGRFEWHHPFFDRYAMAQLLSTGRLTVANYSGNDADVPGVIVDVGCHSWYDGTRFLAIRSAASCGAEVHHGPADLHARIRRHWKRLAQPVQEREQERLRERNFFCLSENKRFAVRQTWEKVLQSSAPEFRVTKCRKLGTATFTTEIEGYHGFFRYDPADVRRIAPPGANAFVLGDPELAGGSAHRAPVTFYAAEVDVTRRIPTEKDILSDFDLLMNVLLTD